MDAGGPLAEGGAAERAHTRRVVALVGSVVVVLTLLATLVPYLLGPPIVLPTPQPVPSLDTGEGYLPEAAPEMSFPPVPEGCPTPLVDAGTHVSVDWVPILIADGREYWGEDASVDLTPGADVLHVECDIMLASAGGQALVPKPWPDGSSTVLPEGTLVSEVVGSPRECFLMADDGMTWLFRAVDEDGGTPTGCVGVPEP